MIDTVEELRQVNIDEPTSSILQISLCFSDCGVRTSVRTESVTALVEDRFRNMSTTLGHSRAAFSELRLWWGDS